MIKLNINVSKKYEVLIGKNLLAKAPLYIEKVAKSKKLFVLTDDIVEGLYGKTFIKLMTDAGFQTELFVIKNGEESKNFEVYKSIINSLASKGFTRNDSLIALGGGVVGDIGGFGAATYQRGMGLIQIPTTLLAAVDSSVGGKTAIDLEYGKNLLGSFYQPDLVICDIDTFKTLDRDIYMDGMAEVIKYSILEKVSFKDWLKNEDLLDISQETVFECVRIKQVIVEEDELDKGIRQVLNLGHTIGHSIELLSNYTVSHGLAVAKGLNAIAKISYTLGFCDKKTLDYIYNLLNLHKYPLTISYTEEELAHAILSDKKREDSHINLILIKDIGSCFIHKLKVDQLVDLFKKAKICGDGND